jgi:acyl-CoA thioesterase-1
MPGLVVGRSHKRYLTRLVGHFPVTDVDAMMAARRALLFAALLVTAGSADAAQINIVALGASNTYGKGVARGQDFPAQLQAMLRAKGLDARVANAGINGDTTGGMLARLGSAVPSGTQIVILQPGGNDRRKGQSGRESNIATITSQLGARKIKVIMLDRVLAGMAPQHIQPDGQHLTPEGYRIIAARLLPQVTAAVGR